MLPHELIGRNYAANPDQGNSRSSRDYGNTGRLEYEPWPDAKPATPTWVRWADITIATCGAIGLFCGIVALVVRWS